MNQTQISFSLKRLTLVLLTAILLVAGSLALLRLNAWAGFAASGAKGCGTFLNALKTAQNNDTIVQMIPLKSTEGAILTKNITIQGGWFPTANCPTENYVFTTTQDLLDAGFQFQAPQTRSILVHNMGPVFTIDPSVMTLTLEHIDVRQLGVTTTMGGGISGVITDGAVVNLENLLITDSVVMSTGGGIYLELHGGSSLIISNSQFLSNTAINGGALDIRLYDNSKLVITGSRISSNTASANGGGIHIIAESGFISITNSSFDVNQAGSNGNALHIESTGNNSVNVWLNDNTFNGNTSVTSQDVYTSGQGITLEGNNIGKPYAVFLPLLLKNVPFATINNISLDVQNNYVVSFTATGFEPEIAPGKHHLHFFFNTVPPTEAGLPGSGPWKIHPATGGTIGTSPFTGYNQSEKPGSATQMCVLIANYDHTVNQGTGNCYNLP